MHGITKSLRDEGYEHTKAISDDREGLTEVVNLQLMRHLSLITFLLRKSEPSNPPPRGWSTGSRRLRKVSNGEGHLRYPEDQRPCRGCGKVSGKSF